MRSKEGEIPVRILGLPWLVRYVYPDRQDIRLCGWRVWRTKGGRNKYKLGVSYNLFDAEELLPASIRAIRDCVDFVNVVYQDVSNHGETHPEDIRGLLQRLKDEGLVDNFVRYEPDFNLLPGKNENRKRKLGARICKANGCTHHLDMDVDEFYDKGQFRRARDFIYARQIAVSACPIYYYILSPQWQMQTYQALYVPFIYRHSWLGIYRGADLFPCRVDPTRKLRRKGRCYVFAVNEVAMHHMSTIRKDLMRKFRNYSLRKPGEDVQKMETANFMQSLISFRFGENGMPDGLDLFEGQVLKRVPDRFGICIGLTDQNEITLAGAS